MGAVPFLCMENMDVTTALVNRLRELWHDELDDARAAGDRAAVVRISKALKELPDGHQSDRHQPGVIEEGALAQHVRRARRHPARNLVSDARAAERPVPLPVRADADLPEGWPPLHPQPESPAPIRHPYFPRRTTKLSSRGRSGCDESPEANVRPRSAAAPGSARPP